MRRYHTITQSSPAVNLSVLEFLYMPDSKVTGTPVHPPTLCFGERVPWKTNNRSTDITRNRDSKHTPDFKTASIMSQGPSVALSFFQLADPKSPASFSALTLELILSYNSLRLDKFPKSTFYGECWNVPSLFFFIKN